LDAKAFNDFLRTLFREDWVVYSKQPFGGPEHVLHYLARYTHRVAISNHRLLNVSEHDVTFRWKDYAQQSKSRAMTLTHQEFLRRFFQHVLPTGFPRIRYFGFLANRSRSMLLPLCRHLLHASLTADCVVAAGEAVHCCPRCQAPMRIVERLTACQLQCDDYRLVAASDTS
jgi:hypothetical protein